MKHDLRWDEETFNGKLAFGVGEGQYRYNWLPRYSREWQRCGSVNMEVMRYLAHVTQYNLFTEEDEDEDLVA